MPGIHGSEPAAAAGPPPANPFLHRDAPRRPPPASSQPVREAASCPELGAVPSDATMDARLRQHEQRWAEFRAAARGGSVVGWADVPWPDFRRENDLLEHAVAAAGGGPGAIKRVVRRAQRRWHPDKLVPLLEQRRPLPPGERRRVNARLGAICEFLAGAVDQ